MRIIRPAVLFLVASVAPMAQGLAQSPNSAVSYGVTGAVNQASFGGSDATYSGSRIGFAIGGFLRKPIDDTWVFQLELQYTTKGTKVSYSGFTSSVDFGYLELPLMFRAFLGGNEKVRPFVEAGPELAVNISCSISASDGTTSQSATCSSIGASPKSFDAGLIGGAGVEFGRWSVGVRYDYGLLDVGNGGSFKNRNLQGVLGFRF
jgi:hypothetical protein